jgi:hypothetical protein
MDLLEDMCPKDVISRLWSLHFEEALKQRNDAASNELKLIVYDHKGVPDQLQPLLHGYCKTVPKGAGAGPSCYGGRKCDESQSPPRLPFQTHFDKDRHP